MNSLIRLFGALPSDTFTKLTSFDYLSIHRETIQKGYIFAQEILDRCDISDVRMFMETIESELMVDSNKINNVLHSSWKNISQATAFELIVKQFVHYITLNEGNSYITEKDFDIPQLKGNKLRVINFLNKEQIQEKLLSLLGTGVALSEQSVKDCIEAAGYCGIKSLKGIKNKEVMIGLSKELGILPENTIDFLRLVVYVTTGSTLLIKSRETIEQIKNSNRSLATDMIEKYCENNSSQLASIFYRFKPIFLAFRYDSHSKKLINRIRRNAKRFHKPMERSPIDMITELESKGELTSDYLQKALEGQSIYRKVRLAQGLKYRSLGLKDIVYKVRNGKTFATTTDNVSNIYGVLHSMVLTSIGKDLYPKIKGKKIYYPKGLEYALPTSEKNFVGNIPQGSYVEVSENLIFGVNWEYEGERHIDLDLSLFDLKGQKYGWDGSYRDKERSILFSGDVTSAHDEGSSELFYVSDDYEGKLLCYLNRYSAPEGQKYGIVVGSEPVGKLHKNYMIDPNNVAYNANATADSHGSICGFIDCKKGIKKFFFYGSGASNSITAAHNEKSDIHRNYLFNYYSNCLYLRDVLSYCGAQFIDNREECDIDLSSESLDKTTIIELLNTNEKS